MNKIKITKRVMEQLLKTREYTCLETGRYASIEETEQRKEVRACNTCVNPPKWGWYQRLQAWCYMHRAQSKKIAETEFVDGLSP